MIIAAVAGDNGSSAATGAAAAAKYAAGHHAPPLLTDWLPISVLTDSYKTTHYLQYPECQKMVAVSTLGAQPGPAAMPCELQDAAASRDHMHPAPERSAWWAPPAPAVWRVPPGVRQGHKGHAAGLLRASLHFGALCGAPLDAAGAACPACRLSLPRLPQPPTPNAPAHAHERDQTGGPRTNTPS